MYYLAGDERMNSAHSQKLNPPNQPLSFEDVSKLFSLPLSEAADILGVTTSALKRICNDHGLERWPHRKYLAGKSIEDIKKEAAKEKNKLLGGVSQPDRQKGNVTAGPAASSSPGSNVKDKTPRSAPDMSKSLSNAQQPGNRTIHTWRSHHLLASGLALEASSCLDDFQSGFPSGGLSRFTNKWWGSASEGHDGVSKDDRKAAAEVKHASEAEMDDNSATTCEEKADTLMKDSISDLQEKVSLSTVRKRARDEGRKALKLGLLKNSGVDKLEKEEKMLLQRLFQTRFPINGYDALSLC